MVTRRHLQTPEVPDADESPDQTWRSTRKDRIAALIHEEFAGHGMAVLIEALLTGAGLHVLAQPRRARTAGSICWPGPARWVWIRRSWWCRSRASSARSATR